MPGQLRTSETRVIQCNHPVRGRYVTVNLNQLNPLTICEFEVHGTPAGNHSFFVFSEQISIICNEKLLCTFSVKMTLLTSASRNLALNKPAWQSSIYANKHDHGLPHEAVDGNASSDYVTDFSCTHTKDDTIPWWTVDLEGQFMVEEVVITNRGDCCGNTLKFFPVHY